ncbi:Protein CBG26855 [Caenorhabditis briggsae]|uniref:Protein CBG26855 n=1 Tax=Caenorhabditis briggsae TaxID=6238 RepID=B6IM20_CAEBR|nr:Protein CBG26855 [Caenorhabditis briggsae]CAS00950.1 Protein CBG26855 [Caenorhabditis briggsae]
MKDNRRIWSEVLKALNAMEKDNGVEVLVPFMRSNGSSIEVMKNEGIDPESFTEIWLKKMLEQITISATSSDK